MEVKAEYREIFAEEARDHVEEWEQSLLRLEHTPGDRELIHGMFRAIHTLKGSSGFIGFDKLLTGKSPQEKNILFVDTLGEVANMITGNATGLLNQRKDCALKITTPAIATGERLSINLVPKPALVLGLYTQYGPIEISIAVEEQETLDEMAAQDFVLREA